MLVDNYVKQSKQAPWLVYSRQPSNVWFSHAIHTRRAGLACTDCHGNYGESDQIRIYEENRISGYSRDIWGHSISRLRRAPHDGMKMSGLRKLPSPPQRRGWLPRLSPMKERRMKVSRRDLLIGSAGVTAGLIFTPVPWKLLGDVSIWTQNWPWIPQPAHGPVETKQSVCTLVRCRLWDACANGRGLAGRDFWGEHSSNYQGRVVSAWFRSSPVELASTPFARSAASRARRRLGTKRRQRWKRLAPRDQWRLWTGARGGRHRRCWRDLRQSTTEAIAWH